VYSTVRDRRPPGVTCPYVRSSRVTLLCPSSRATVYMATATSSPLGPRSTVWMRAAAYVWRSECSVIPFSIPARLRHECSASEMSRRGLGAPGLGEGKSRPVLGLVSNSALRMSASCGQRGTEGRDWRLFRPRH